MHTVTVKLIRFIERGMHVNNYVGACMSGTDDIHIIYMHVQSDTF